MSRIVPFPNAAPAPDAWIPERDVLELRPMLSVGRLRRARAGHKIEWTPGKRGSAWYRLTDVDAYIRGEMTCHAREAGLTSNSAANGSPESATGETGTDIGLSQELETHVARHLAQQI